ncbi:MAG: hypothetical protein ACRC3H_01405 [Lachnospiraceae bacterium]
MKRLAGMFCIIILFIITGTLAVYAEDGTVESGAGITFEGTYPEEPEEPEEQAPRQTSESIKASLPQTGQGTRMVLPIAGGAILIIVSWCQVRYVKKFT